MSCSHCLNAVAKALSQVAGVEVRSVRIGRVELRLAGDPPDPTPARTAIESAGYKVEGILGPGAGPPPAPGRPS